MSFWREPELPKMQKLPKRAKKPPSYGARIFVGLVGLILLFLSGLGVHGALTDKTGQKSPFTALFGLMPAVVMIRYALTGKIKVN